jgi:hypothetical protein
VVILCGLFLGQCSGELKGSFVQTFGRQKNIATQKLVQSKKIKKQAWGLSIGSFAGAVLWGQVDKH